MKLQDFLTATGVKPAEFAQDVGVTVQAIHRYLNGERIPERGVMSRIQVRTDNKVTADSFYQ